MLAEISLKNQTAAHKASRRALCICLLALAFGPLGACSDDNTSAPTDPFDGCEETDSCADRCQSDQDCEVGQRCEASSGQCVSAECLVDAHCGADQRCVERACQDRPDEPVDSDGDGIFDDEDNCPRALNDDQADLDGDGQGDACDGDLDGDGVLNGLDNCPVSANPMQEDPDGDGLGLVCHGGTVSVPFGVARGVVGQRLDTATRPDESSAACGGAGAPEVAFLTALHPGEELRARVEASHGLALYVLDAQGEVVACEAADALSFVAEVEGPYTLVIDGKGADDAGMIQLQLSVIGDEVAVESVDYDLEGVPGAVWAGRLNDDEYLDMVAIDTEAGQLTISLGIEGDQFAAPVTLAVEGNPVAIWGGDLNNDGADDIALALADSDQVAVFFNEGQGAEVDFSAQRNANVGDNPVAIWGGDLNNDGGIELAVVNEGSNDVSVISVGERGALIPAGRFEVGEGPVAIWGGDLNNDGHPDLATANFDGGTGSTVSVIPGTGNGLMDIGFGQAQAHEIGQGPRAIWGGDLNNDGGIELAVVHDGGTSGGLLSILPNLGAELGAPISHPIGENPVAIWGGDLNNDGHPDLATANFGDSSLSLLLGDGQGGLGEAEAVGLESPPVYIWGGDLNNDGSPDLMAPGGAALGMAMVMSRATGFSGALGDPSGGLEGIWGGDLNRDGNVDLAFVHKDNNTLMVRMGTRNGTFAAAQEFQVGQAPLFIWGGDLNRDGGADLVVANSAGPLSMNKDGEGEGSLSVLLSNPDGTLAQPVELAVDAGARTIWGDHDFNGDGLPDLAVATRDSNSVSVLLATGPGLFEDGHLSLPLGGDLNEDNQPIEAPLGIWGGDLNNDGHPDLVTAGTRSGSFSVFNGRGDGSFEEPTRVPTGGTGSATVWGDDLNGDGRVDLATNNLDDGQMAVLINGSGEGVLRLNQPELYEIGTGFGQVWGGDITNDGLPDLVTTNNDGINVFTGYNAGGFAGRQQLAVGQGAKWIWGDDFTGDGVPDIATTGDNGLEIRVGRRQSPLQAPGARPVRAQLPPCPATDLTGRINVRRGEITFNAGAFERPCQVERLEVSVEYSARLRTTSFLGDDTVITLGNANLNEDARDSVLVHSVGRIPAPGRWRPEHLPGLARFEGAPVGGVWRLKASSARCRRSDGACLPLFTRVTLHINPVPVDPFNGGGGNAFCTSGADQPDPPAQPCRWDGAALDGLIDREGDVDPLLIDGPKGGGLAAGSTVTVTLTTDSGTLPPSLSLQAFGARLPLARAAQVEEGRLELTFVVPPAFDGRYATLEISAPPGAALPLAYSIEASFE